MTGLPGKRALRRPIRFARLPLRLRLPRQLRARLRPLLLLPLALALTLGPALLFLFLCLLPPSLLLIRVFWFRLALHGDVHLLDVLGLEDERANDPERHTQDEQRNDELGDICAAISPAFPLVRSWRRRVVGNGRRNDRLIAGTVGRWRLLPDDAQLPFRRLLLQSLVFRLHRLANRAKRHLNPAGPAADRHLAAERTPHTGAVLKLSLNDHRVAAGCANQFHLRSLRFPISCRRA